MAHADGIGTDSLLVRVGASPPDRAQAIEQAAALLVAAGAVEAGFADSMRCREAVSETYLGGGIAIPHGMVEDRGLIRRDAIAVLQVPGGVEWTDGQVARLVIAIAARSDTHLAILRRLTGLIGDDALLARLCVTTDAAAIVAALSGEVAEGPRGIDLAHTLDWVMDYPSGLHARPASRWVEAAREAGRTLRVRSGARVADPSRLLSLLQLGAGPGETLVLSADGDGAAPVLAAFRDRIAAMSAGEIADVAAQAAKRSRPGTRAWPRPGAGPTLDGIAASPGLVMARLHVLSQGEVAVADIPAPLVEGGRALEAAVGATKARLRALADDTQRRLGAAEAAIFTAQSGMLDDPDLLSAACREMVEGHGAAFAWSGAVAAQASALEQVGNPVLAARATDLRDVGRRVLAVLDPSVEQPGGLADLPPEPVILVASDLTPSDTASLDPARVVGLVTALGGPAAHTAILARTLGLPAAVGLGAAAIARIGNGTLGVLDGDGGRLHLQLDEADQAGARDWITLQRRRAEAEAAERAAPCVTTDGVALEIMANVNLPEQAGFAVGQGADGVGLMRTEFLYLERARAPTEDEQLEIYRAMIAALAGRPLIVRTLDIGGDKQVPHLQLPHEENPFLGVRGARLLLRRPDLMQPQLRALYRAAAEAPAGGRLSIMFPMVTSLAELLSLRQACEATRLSVGGPVLPVGIMVEVPAAALEAARLAEHADFFSIGTNDLTQYTLAIDRQNAVLAAEADALHPAVLRLVQATVAGAARFARPVGVCGGLAGDPFGASLLAGLGVHELSMTPRDIPPVKARLRRGSMAAFRALAARALEADSADAVRALDPADMRDTEQAA